MLVAGNYLVQGPPHLRTDCKICNNGLRNGCRQKKSSNIGYCFSKDKKINFTYLIKNISALMLIHAVLSTGWIL